MRYKIYILLTHGRLFRRLGAEPSDTESRSHVRHMARVSEVCDGGHWWQVCSCL